MELTTELRILQWKIQCLRSNKLNLIALIYKYSPEIVLLNVIWLKYTQSFYVKNYNVVRVDKPNNMGGRIATLIHNNIRFNVARTG